MNNAAATGAIVSTNGGGNKATKTVTTINLCRSTFNKFIIVTPAVSIDRDCDGDAGGGGGGVALDMVVMEEPNGLGLSRTIAVVRDENNNNNENNNEYNHKMESDYAGQDNTSYTWNQWWCSLVYTAVRCFGSGGTSTAAGTTTKLLQPCQYRRGWTQHQQQQQQRRRQDFGKTKVQCDMNNNGFYSRRAADGTYEL